MSSDHETLLMILRAIADLPEPERTQTQQIAQQIRDVVRAAGGPGIIALGLVGAEAACNRL